MFFTKSIFFCQKKIDLSNSHFRVRIFLVGVMSWNFADIMEYSWAKHFLKIWARNTFWKYMNSHPPTFLGFEIFSTLLVKNMDLPFKDLVINGYPKHQITFFHWLISRKLFFHSTRFIEKSGSFSGRRRRTKLCKFPTEIWWENT